MKLVNIIKKQDFLGVAVDKNQPADVGDMGLIPGLGRVCFLWNRSCCLWSN